MKISARVAFKPFTVIAGLTAASGGSSRSQRCELPQARRGRAHRQTGMAMPPAAELGTTAEGPSRRWAPDAVVDGLLLPNQSDDASAHLPCPALEARGRLSLGAWCVCFEGRSALHGMSAAAQSALQHVRQEHSPPGRSHDGEPRPSLGACRNTSIMLHL